MSTTRSIGTAALLAALPAAAHGAIITQGITPAPGNITRLSVDMINNDQGAVYDSATLEGLFLPLAQAIYDWGVSVGNPVTAYADAQAFLDSWPGGLTAAGQINASTGWNVSGRDPLELTHNEGFPGFDYTAWASGLNSFLILDIHNSYLTASGNAADWGDPDKGTYANIILSDNTVQNAFVGKTGSAIGAPTYSADGLAYQLVIIPAPAPTILLAFAAPALIRRKR